MDTASRPARQPRISWLMLQKKLSDSSGCTIKNETLVCTQKSACWVISQSRQVELVSVRGLERTVSKQISGALFFLVTVSYWKDLTAPAPSSSGRLTQQGLKKQTRAERAGPSNTSGTPTSNSLNLTRSSLSLSHEPAWKLSGLVNGETPTASLSAVPTV